MADPPISTPRILTSHLCLDLHPPSSHQKVLILEPVRPPFPLRGPLTILGLRMLTTATGLPVTTTAPPLGEKCLASKF